MSFTLTLTFPTGENLLTQGVVAGDEMKNVVVSAGATFLKGGTVPAAFTDYDQLLVTSVDVSTPTVLTFDAYKAGVLVTPSTAPIIGLASGQSVTFDISHTNTKAEQIAAVIAIANSYASNRVLCVWPPQADWDDGNGGTVTLDGSALCAALAGAMASYPAQQSFTNLPISGPQKLDFSNTYFTPTQLNELSAAGVFVVVQDTPGAKVYSRHQVTTDMTSLDKQEFSVTKAIDKISLDLYNLVKPFIGKYNVTQNLLTQLTDLINQYLFTAQNTSAPYCGSLILSSSNLKVAAQLGGQNLDIPLGTVAISMTVEVGFPANYINITLNVA